MAYKKVDTHLLAQVERSKINQVAPIINTETDDGGEYSQGLITENNAGEEGHLRSQMSHFSRVSIKKKTSKKGILGKSAKPEKRERKRRKTIFRKNKKVKTIKIEDSHRGSHRSRSNLKSYSNFDKKDLEFATG